MLLPTLQSHPPNDFTRLEVRGGALGELEVDVAACETTVDLRVGVEAVVNTTTLLLVKDDLQELAAVLLGADALANDLDGVGEVGKDGVVDSSEGARAGTLLLLGVASAGRALGAGKDAARGEDQDVAVGELLLELTSETRTMSVYNVLAIDWEDCFLPLLDTVEARQGGDGDKDDNSLLAVANLDLFKIQSQHASSRTRPWTASRPVPQKSIVLRSLREPLVPMREPSVAAFKRTERENLPTSSHEYSIVRIYGRSHGEPAAERVAAIVLCLLGGTGSRKESGEVFFSSFKGISPHGQRRSAEGAERP